MYCNLIFLINVNYFNDFNNFRGNLITSKLNITRKPG